MSRAINQLTFNNISALESWRNFTQRQRKCLQPLATRASTIDFVCRSRFAGDDVILEFLASHHDTTSALEKCSKGNLLEIKNRRSLYDRTCSIGYWSELKWSEFWCSHSNRSLEKGETDLSIWFFPEPRSASFKGRKQVFSSLVRDCWMLLKSANTQTRDYERVRNTFSK